MVGVDGVFIGPSDLAADMGFLGNTGAPEVQAAIESALARIRAAGKAAGILTTNADEAKKWVDMGANFIAVSVDVIVYAEGMRKMAADRKALLKGDAAAEPAPTAGSGY